jgi:hypothetical protein|tara:strand:+ start:146 stop:436 length:291 start_codon:yes stop_codon:yes gene_type:complete
MELIQSVFVRRDWGEDYFQEWHEDWTVQAWMERLFRNNGNTGDFNGAEYPLAKKAIDQLEVDMPNLKELCVKAREALKEGETVFYTSSWFGEGWDW